jgi:hypothetical protein
MIAEVMTAETSRRFLFDGIFFVLVIAAAYGLARWIERK